MDSGVETVNPGNIPWRARHTARKDMTGEGDMLGVSQFEAQICEKQQGVAYRAKGSSQMMDSNITKQCSTCQHPCQVRCYHRQDLKRESWDAVCSDHM